MFLTNILEWKFSPLHNLQVKFQGSVEDEKAKDASFDEGIKYPTIRQLKKALRQTKDLKNLAITKKWVQVAITDESLKNAVEITKITLFHFT